MGDLIGKSVKRVEDNRFLKGEGKYTLSSAITMATGSPTFLLLKLWMVS